jgi:alanine racemase
LIRPVWAEVDLAAVRSNAALVAAAVSPARLCAVVKAGGYGHGAPQAGRAALEGGAEWLAVALVEEGIELREAGIQAPVLLLSEPPREAMGEVVGAGLTPTLYTVDGVEALAKQVRERAAGSLFPVHVKVDTGMHRVGAAPDEAIELASAVAASAELELQGFWTHLAISEQLEHPYTAEQLSRFDFCLAELRRRGVEPSFIHAANSAAALWRPSSRYGMVRAGITIYGLAPSPAVATRPPADQLRPAMSLKARVSHVKELEAGEAVSYGLRYRLQRQSVVATVPVGYADGLTRSLSAAGGQVLIGGRRFPIAGTVTMDQILVDCGPGAKVSVGDEVVLLGRQGTEEISAWEWAQLTGTIAYEVVCAISSRVPRVWY